MDCCHNLAQELLWKSKGPINVIKWSPNGVYIAFVGFEIEETPVQEEEIERIREEDQGQVLGISSEEVIDDLVVFADDYNGLLRIKRPEEMIINKILFFNMIGQQLGAWKTQLDDSQIHLPIHVNAGVYVMLFETNEGRILKKIIVK